MRKIAMIVTDLDDTLLRSDKTISDAAVVVLQRCQSAGIKVAFATARSTQAAAASMARFAPDVFIGYGGALIKAGNETIHRCEIPADVADRLIQTCLRTPGITGVHAINESIALTNGVGVDMMTMSHYTLTDFAGDYGNSYMKISVTSDDPAAVERIAAQFPMCDMLRYSGENLYRFANRHALKWNAVQIAAAHFGMATDAMAAFGDDVNDVEMIARCGIGVAVANAVAQVKAVAAHHCASNDEDGVARWIEEHVLGR